MLSRADGGAGGSVQVGSGGIGGNGGGRCPVVPIGGACDVPDLLCTYGDDPRPLCRIAASCFQGMWLIAVPRCNAPVSCDPVVPPDGAPCMLEGDVCWYADGTLCSCTSCTSPGVCMMPPAWRCVTPEPGCPTLAPNAGTACDVEGQACTYGDPCFGMGAHAVCKNAEWTWEMLACPQ